MKALVLGGADSLWADVEAIEAMTGEWDGMVIACNDAGVHWPRFLDHWCSRHPESFRSMPNGSPGWEEQRAALGHPDGYATWARRAPELVDHLVFPWTGGDSGLFCLAVAERLGVTHAILCGVPMDPTPHFNDHHRFGTGRWAVAMNFRRQWERPRIQARMAGWVRSMSGWTKETLGAPTPEWLRDGGRRLAG